MSGQITSSSPARCPAGQSVCGSTCVDTASDPSHCGACGTSCAAEQVCTGGACSATCANGLTDCARACVDTSSDSANCGACGNACDATAGLTCSGGQCVAATPGCSYCRDGSGNACNEGGSCGTELVCKGGFCILGADLYDVYVDAAQATRFPMSFNAAPPHRYRGIEATPWVASAGATYTYSITTAESSNCTSSASLANASSVAVTCNAVNTRTVTTQLAEGQPDTLARPWARVYDGIFSEHVVTGYPGKGDILLTVNHGENANTIWNWGDVTTRVQNSVSSIPSLDLDHCWSDFTESSFSPNALDCYFAFLSTGWLPLAQATSGVVASNGPIAWPANGYLHADGTQASRGLRHPSSIVDNGYLYVFYLDGSLDGLRGIRVVRAPVTSALDPSAWERLDHGHFVSGTLPPGFSLDASQNIPSQLYAMKSPPNDFVLPPDDRAERFAVARLNDTGDFVGVEGYSEATGHFMVALRFSRDLIHWSERHLACVPGFSCETFDAWNIGYPVFLSEDGASNTLVDTHGFFLFGAYQHGTSEVGRIPVRLSRKSAGGTFDGYDLILIAGQSNAVGFGCGPYTPLHAEQDPLIDQIKPDLSIIPASDPLWHNDGTNKVGFGLAFARLYAQESLAPNRRVLIVPVARGATSILEWNKANEGIDFSSTGLPSSPELWNMMITRLDAALAAGPGTHRVAAVLWQQGESDYNFINDPSSPFHASMSSPDVYRQRLERWIADLRAAEPATAGAPFIRGEVPRFWPPPALVASDPQLVTQLNAAIASASIPNAGLAQTGGLLSGASFSCMDAAHINAMSQTEFGRRFYETYRTMKGLPARPVTSDLIRTSYVDQSVDMGCAYFNPDAIKQLPEETIRWLAALMPSGLTLHEHYLTARQHGYFGPLGEGGHSTWLSLSPNLQSDFDSAVSAMANADMSPSWPTWRDHHVARRAAGYEGLFLCGGDGCFQAGQCDSLGRRL